MFGMTSDPLRSRLVAILAADAAGYSRSMARDERAAVAALDRARAVFREAIGAHGGRVIDMAGDSVMSVFDTALGAVQAALDVQRALAGEGDADDANTLRFRIGVHVGDVLEKADGTVYGDGVNTAARIEGLAVPGSVAVSGAVHALVARRVEATFDDIGEQSVKNIPQPVHVYRIRPTWIATAAAPPAEDRRLRTLSFDGGRVRIDLAARQLLIGGTPSKLGGRAFDLLVALVERRDRVVPKQELLDVVWPGLIVEENNLHVHVATLRRLLGAQALSTVSGRGYRYTLSEDAPLAGTEAARERRAPVPAAPADARTLLGREALLAEATGRLLRSDVRLLTLSGPGGSGKTRVAMRLAADFASRLADGSYIVLLAPVREATHLMAAVALALGIKESGAETPTQLVKAYLRPREVLLTLDNFEQLAEAAPQVAELLAECPRLKVLVTSRVLLHLSGEQELKVPPLALPQADDPDSVLASPAVALFGARAAQFGRDLRTSPQDLTAAVRICRHLDGLPLAIELAAARLRALTPTALADRLHKSLALLKGGDADVPQRQQTLRNTIAWSYELLEPPQRALFNRLGVFAGGWSLEAAEALADDVEALDELEMLIEHNLVQRVDDVEGEPRFAMLETIREYALEQLEAEGLTATMRDRHARFHAGLAQRSEPQLTSPGRLSHLMRLRAEMSNLRQALAWLMHDGRDVPAAMTMAAALTWLWYFDGLFAEGRAWLRQAQALPGAADHERPHAAVLSGEARLASFGGDMAEAHRLGEQSIEAWRRLGDRRGLAFALFNDGVPSSFIAGKQASVAVLREARELFRDLGDAWGVALANTYEGVVLAFTPGTEDEALATLNEALARCTALGDEWAATTCCAYIASVAMRRGDFKTARRNFLRGMDNARETNDRFRIARAAYLIGQLELIEKRPRQAATWLRESLVLGLEQGRTNETPQILRGVARALAMLGQHDVAAVLLGAGSHEPAMRPTLPPEPPAAIAAAIDSCRQALGDDRYDERWHAGQLLSGEQAVQRATAAVDSLSPATD